MRVLPIELAEDTVDALEIERELLGFESRSAYVRWLLAHRGSIASEDTEGATALDAYRERIAQLEAALEVEDADARESEPSPTETAIGDGGARTDTGGVDAGGWKVSRSDPTVEVRGSPRRTVRRETAGGEQRETEAAVATDSRRDANGSERRKAPKRRLSFGENVDRLDGSIEATNLTPERVERVREDPVAEDAGVLGSVEVGRLDELARRAVAKTRERLDRDVQTGLEYTASTGLEADDVRPGEDVVDLDRLSVPGRSADVVDRRREAVGRAIAYLRDEKRARKSDFVDTLYEEWPAGYETADSWWRCVKSALKQVDSIDGGDGSRVWSYDG